MKILRHISIIIAILLATAGCSRSRDARLQNLYELTSTDPRQALTALDTINTADLSAADRDFADFVRLKASDKLYIDHTSDSTILRLLDRFRHDPALGPEMLYYAGRVYSDLGDYPTALGYFQTALDATPTEKNPLLRCHIASQTGRLLNSIKLHTQAVPYLKETLRLDSLLRDTVNLMYDHQLIGDVYIRANHLDSAQIMLNKAMFWAKFLTEEETSLVNAYLAHIAYLKGDYSRALSLIRGVPEKQPLISQNLPLLFATQIYRANGELDSAYFYVNNLIHSKLYKNRCAGFEELFCTELKEFVPKDSLHQYLITYNRLLDFAAKNNSVESAIFQNSYFNYNNHIEKRIEAENRKNTIVTTLYGVAILVLVLIVIVCFLKISYQKSQIELHEALEDIIKLNDLLQSSKQIVDNLQKEKQNHKIENIESEPENNSVENNADSENSSVENNTQSPTGVNPDLSDLFIESEVIERIKHELLQLSELTQQNDDLKTISRSKVYREFKECLKNDQVVKYDNPKWKELERVILSISPNFKDKFQLILGEPLSNLDLQTILLIKSGFSNTEIAALCGRYSSAISERRKKLCVKIFGPNLGIAMFNNIIRNL